MRIFLATTPVDFRKGIDGLGAVCRQVLREDPFCGGMFIFRNKRCSALKILVYDGQGFWLFCKRLSRGKFQWWPDGGGEVKSSFSLTPAQLHLLLWNGDPSSAKISEEWKKLPLL